MAERDQRKGFAFGNPQNESDYYHPGWGLLITPDELRYLVTFGTKLVASDASQTFTDNNLQYYIDHAIGMVEADLHIDIYPRIVRHNAPIDNITGARQRRTDIPEEEPGRVIEPGYPYNKELSYNYLYTKLRRRPLIEVLKAKLVDPIQNTLIDIYTWRHEQIGLEAVVQFFPNTATALTGLPFISSGHARIRYPFENYPEAILIDYKTGWSHSKEVPLDLREAIRKIAGIMLLADFGDGRSAAIGSQSASLNSISESFNTTMSATSAMYGARIQQWQKDLKTWYHNNAKRYQRAVFGVFG